MIVLLKLLKGCYEECQVLLFSILKYKTQMSEIIVWKTCKAYTRGTLIKHEAKQKKEHNRQKSQLEKKIKEVEQIQKTNPDP